MSDPKNAEKTGLRLRQKTQFFGTKKHGQSETYYSNGKPILEVVACQFTLHKFSLH